MGKSFRKSKRFEEEYDVDFDRQRQKERQEARDRSFKQKHASIENPVVDKDLPESNFKVHPSRKF